jgi:acyl carrier protein
MRGEAAAPVADCQRRAAIVGSRDNRRHRSVSTKGRLRMQRFDIDVRSRIVALIEAILRQNAIAADIGPEARLVDIGLTSMDMVSLMLGVEVEFDFTIPQAEITPENFQSVEALERMVRAQLQPEKVG